MVWALVNDVEMEVRVNNPAVDPSWETVMAPIGTIVNLIEYDGVTPYEPAENLRLVEVPNTAKIGDSGY